MRTIEKVVEEIKSVYPNYVNPMMGDDDNQRLHDRLNEILEIHEAEKRPKGKWENCGIGGCKICSVCNAHMGLSNFKFCPNCGSYNRGDENGDE